MTRIEVEGLPGDPLAAAGMFQHDWLGAIERAIDNGADVTVVLQPADHTHGEWRCAMAAMLARKHTPRRVNLIAGEGARLDAIAQYLAGAPGVTGQYLEASA